MQSQLSANAWWVLLLFGFLIVGVPFGIWMSLRNRNLHNQIDLLIKASSRMRRPWEKEDQMIQELSDRVAALKEKDHRNPPLE